MTRSCSFWDIDYACCQEILQEQASRVWGSTVNFSGTRERCDGGDWVYVIVRDDAQEPATQRFFLIPFGNSLIMPCFSAERQ